MSQVLLQRTDPAEKLLKFVFLLHICKRMAVQIAHVWIHVCVNHVFFHSGLQSITYTLQVSEVANPVSFQDYFTTFTVKCRDPVARISGIV